MLPPGGQVLRVSQLIDIGIETVTEVPVELNTTLPSLIWAGGRTVQVANTGQYFGMLPIHVSKVMTTLSESIGVTYQLHLQLGRASAGASLAKPRMNAYSGLAQVSVIVYGPTDEAIEVGEWLDACNLFLQEPERCARNVPYRNPQSLSFNDPEIMMTSELENKRNLADISEDCQPLDFMTELDNDDLLEEAEQPDIIATPLHRCNPLHPDCNESC